MKKILGGIILVLCCFPAFSQTTDTLTIVTYYPAPFGSYKQLYSEYFEIHPTATPYLGVNVNVSAANSANGVAGNFAWQTAFALNPGAGGRGQAIVLKQGGGLPPPGAGDLLFGIMSSNRTFYWQDVLQNQSVMILDHQGNLSILGAINTGVADCVYYAFTGTSGTQSCPASPTASGNPYFIPLCPLVPMSMNTSENFVNVASGRFLCCRAAPGT